MEALVSIIIPVYNAENYLEQCIHSALNQTWQNIEIIVVNDGSTDGSLILSEKFVSTKVKVINQPNSGASAARNHGLKYAKGSYIQFLDADDILSTDKIESQVECFNGSLNHLALCKQVHFMDGDNYLNATVNDEWFYGGPFEPIDFLIKLYAGEETLPGYGGMIQPNTWLVPRLLIDKAGPWNEKINVDDDGEFFCRVVLASQGILFANRGFNYYRKFRDSKSLSGQTSKKSIESAILSNTLKHTYLTKYSNNGIINKIFAKHFWWQGVLAYPQYPDLSKICIKKGKELGYNGEKYVGGPLGHSLASIFGWKATRFLFYYLQLLKQK